MNEILTPQTERKTKRIKRKRAVKSYGSQLEIKAKSYGLYMDWLTLNLSGIPIFNEDKYIIEKEDYSTRQFEHIIQIKTKNEHIGTLTYGALNKFVKITDYCQFKFANHLFYTKTPKQLQKIKDDLLNDFGLVLHGVSRLDVALDFQNASEKVQKFYKELTAQKILIGGREKDFNKYNQLREYTKTKGGKVTLEGLQMGSRKSRKFCRLYNKTLEMQKVNKSYISQTWQNLKIKGEVWRLEYQLNATYLKSIEGFELDKLFDINYLMSLFEKCIDKHFVFHKAIKGREINKMPKVNLLDFERVKKYVKCVTKPLKTVKRVIKETLIGQMRMIKGLLRSYFSTSQRLEYIIPLKTMLDDFDLNSWFTKKLPFYVQEFRSKQIMSFYDEQQFNEHLSIEI